MFKLVPYLVTADAIGGAGRKLDGHVVKPEIPVDLQDQSDDRFTFVLHLRRRAEYMGVVLREVAHAHETVQGPGRLVAMNLAEFGHADWQVTIAFQAVGEDRYRSGAVHRLQREGAPVFGFGGEHVVAIIGPVPGYLP